MLAARFYQTGNPADVLRIEEIPRPVPGRGEVLVRIEASPVNPSDLQFVQGRYSPAPQLPATPGFEGAGIVEEAGPGMLGRFLLGRRVAAIARAGGDWAEYALVPARQAVPIPASLSLEQAATFFVNPVTAWAMTREVLKVPPGEWLLQSAAASSLGRMIIRLGTHFGIRTINVVRRESQIGELAAAGADHVLKFDATTDDPDALVQQVRQLSGGGVRYALDPVGGIVGSTLIRCLSQSGRLLTFGTLSFESLSVPPRELISRAACVEGFALGAWMEQQGLLRKVRLMRRVGSLIETGVLATSISRRIPLAALPGALSENVGGKQLITMSATHNSRPTAS
jgi:NADPH:quinone reductase